MAFRLNEAGLIQRVFQAIPYTDIGLVVEHFPTVYVARLLRYVAAQTEQSPHVEFCLLWIKALVDKHGAWLTANRGKVDVELRIVARAVGKMKDEVRRLADENVYMVDYLLGQARDQAAAGELGGNEGGVKALPAKSEVTIHDIMEQDEESEAEWIGLE